MLTAHLIPLHFAPEANTSPSHPNPGSVAKIHSQALYAAVFLIDHSNHGSYWLLTAELKSSSFGSVFSSSPPPILFNSQGYLPCLALCLPSLTPSSLYLGAPMLLLLPELYPCSQNNPA